MRLLVLFLVCSIGLSYAADSYAQKAMISIDVHNQRVEDILKEIEAQSDFDFFFNNKHVDLNRRVSVSADKSNIFSVLKEIFAGTNVKYSVLDKKIILSVEAQSPQQEKKVTVSGTVLDTHGEPVIGASVLEKGVQGNGTITDIDGIFKLSVSSSKAQLDISYIGYQSQTVAVQVGKNLKIILQEDSKQLEEVVVVGYGTQSKKTLTGAVSMVNMGDVEMNTVPNYSQNKYDNVPLGDKVNEYSGVLTGAIQSNPTIPIYDSEGNYFIDPKRPFVANPVSLLEIKDNTVKDRLIGSAFVSVKPLKELEVKLQLGADRSFQKRSSYLPKTTLQGANKNGRADISQETSTTYLMELTAQYSKSFGDHNLKAIGGYSFQKFKNDGFSAGNSDFLVDGFGYNSLGSGNYKKPSVSSWASINSIASLFARANYSYKGKYLLEATVRADAASNFAPENRWGYFPSVSAGWMISEENFMKGASKWLSMLKLRASYGQTGNSNVGYRIYDYYEVGRNAIIGGAESTGVYASDLGNKSITWETTTEFNLGVDFGIFNNRFKLAAEYFKRKITDLLVTNKPLPFYNEVNKIAGNIGSTQSQGVEITLNTVNIVTKDFEWDTTLTLSHYNDRWLKRDPNWKPRAYEKEDDPIRAWWEYEAIGILQPGEKAPDAQKDLVPGMMKLKDRDGNGVLGDEDKVYMGNGDPKIIYGLNNSFRYKNFDLNIYFYGEAGRKRGASYYEGWTRMDNGINVSTYALKAFSSNNLTATDPTYVRGGNGWGDYYVKSIYYVRCGSITLGYKVPISQKIVNNLRVYVDVNNPFVITNWTGLDPETDNGTYAYPNVTSYNFGVSISF